MPQLMPTLMKKRPKLFNSLMPLNRIRWWLTACSPRSRVLSHTLSLAQVAKMRSQPRRRKKKVVPPKRRALTFSILSSTNLCQKLSVNQKCGLNGFQDSDLTWPFHWSINPVCLMRHWRLPFPITKKCLCKKPSSKKRLTSTKIGWTRLKLPQKRQRNHLSMNIVIGQWLSMLTSLAVSRST